MSSCDTGDDEPVELVCLPTSIPDRVGPPDVARIEGATGAFRALDAQYGGGACYDAVVAFLSWAGRLLEAEATEQITKNLYVALADLYGLAGWAAFDLNRVDDAHSHFDRAFTLAKLCDNDALVADVGYRRGRLYLHHDSPEKAQLEFQLAQCAAADCGSPVAAAILYANQAWASATMGRADESVTLLGQCVDEFLRCGGMDVPTWAQFFDTTHLSAICGVIYTELARNLDPAYTCFAIPALVTAAGRTGSARSRSKSLTLITLASSHLLQGRADRAVQAGAAAIETARKVTSARTTDRLLQLRHDADQRSTNPDARELSDLITTFVDPAAGRRAPAARTPPGSRG